MGVVGNSSCTKCTLHETAQSVCLMGRGRIPCNVMIVGEAPGRREDDIGKPFQGKAGELLDDYIAKNNWSRKDIYITNAVRCRPPDNRTPRAREIKACSEWMVKEYEEVKPKFVLLLGNTAIKTVPIFHGKRITQVRGKPVEYKGVIYLPTFHPAACLRNHGKRGNRFIYDFAADIRYFFEICSKGKIRVESEISPFIVMTDQDVTTGLERIRDSKRIVSHDLETQGLNPFLPKKEIVMAGIGLHDGQVIFPLKHPDMPWFKNRRRRLEIVSSLWKALKEKFIIYHNGKFDTLWLLVKYGLSFHINFDTMIGHYLYDENAPHGLKLLASQFFAAPNYDISETEKQGKDISLTALAEYCAGDVYYTRKLYFLIRKLLAEDFMLNRFFHEVLLPVFNMFKYVEQNGLYLDQNQYEAGKAECTKIFEQSKAKLDKVSPSTNWGSPQQVGKVLFKELGFPVLDLTKTKKPSTSESVLLRLRDIDESDTIASLLKFKEAKKQLEFFKSWGDKQIDSYIHPTFKFLTVTGRLSCEEPNIQQVPRNPVLRSCISAPPGWMMVEADYSQVELRVAASIANEKTMISIFLADGDIHMETALRLTGKLEHEITSEDRKKSKPVNFGFLYRMGWRKFKIYARDNYGVDFTDSECQEYRDIYFETYNRLPAWHKRQMRLVRSRGFVRNLLGRIRHLPQINSEDESEQWAAERQAINSPVQGTASDINLVAGLCLSQTFPNDVLKLCAPVHDAWLMLVRAGNFDILPKIKEIMEYPPLLEKLGVRLRVPLKVDIKIGPWGKGKPYEEFV